MAAPIKIDKALWQFATVGQLEVLEAIEDHGSLRAAGRALGKDIAHIVRVVQAVKLKAATTHGVSPELGMTQPLLPGQIVKGHSQYVKADGTRGGYWLKGKLDQEKYEQMVREMITSLMQSIPRANAAPGPTGTSEYLCNVITLTDVHVGAYAWGKETGADWDLSIAETTVVAAVEHLVRACPPARTCVVAQLGDFLHQDGLSAVTPTSGHQLDSDSRFSKVVQVAVRILRRVIAAALTRHERVVVLMAEGNHDIASSVWLRHMFALLYENEPRVSVIDSELPYYVFQHGQTMLAWHHGHLKKVEQLPLLMAAQFPRIWGETTRRYVHSGHLHHKYEKEHSGITVIQHPTIAARDAYAARGGWIADREMTAITYHSTGGRVASATVTPEMLS